MTKYKPAELTALIESLDLAPVLDDQVRQVRWLYNNGNKCCKVYEEKLVRVIIHHLKQRITGLENRLEEQYHV